MARTPMRPQNRCKKCGYTWHPRGHNVSNKCPNCGSREVSINYNLIGALISFIIICVVIYFIVKSSSNSIEVNGDKSKQNVASDNKTKIKNRKDNQDDNAKKTLSNNDKKIRDKELFDISNSLLEFIDQLNNTKPENPQHTKRLINKVNLLIENSKTNHLFPVYNQICDDLESIKSFWQIIIRRFRKRKENKIFLLFKF